MKVEWDGNFQEKCSKIWVYFSRLSSFSEFMQIFNFYSALATSFGRDHSELDISRKVTATRIPPIKETLSRPFYLYVDKY